MERFQYLTPQPEDLLSIEITGERIKLVTISNDLEEDIFREFTTEVGKYLDMLVYRIDNCLVF